MGTLLGGAGWALLGGCATTSLQQCQQQIANRPVRRNIATLAANDPILVAFRSAITQMQALPDSDPRNWLRQANLHRDHCPHGNWLFLPWHRAYLLYFERICRQLSGMADFALPYWNWTTSPSIPAAYWGTASNPLFHAGRSANAASVADVADIGPSELALIMSDHNFLSFGSAKITAAQDQRTNAGYGQLEGTPHNYIHGFVGGDMGFVDRSPRDPIFWAHHNNLDRRWVQWSFDDNNPYPDDNDWLDREFTEFCDEHGQPVTLSVLATLLFPVFSYRYDDVGPGAAGTSPAARPDSKAAQDAGAKQAGARATIRLDVQPRRLPGPPPPIAATIDQPAALQLTLDPQSVPTTPDGRTLLAFDGATANHTQDFFVRVFLAKPDATAQTSTQDPHFAGSFAFFHHDMPGHGDTGNFSIDVTEVIHRLKLPSGPVQATVVLVPFPDRQLATREFAATGVELRVVKDVIERQK